MPKRDAMSQIGLKVPWTRQSGQNEKRAREGRACAGPSFTKIKKKIIDAEVCWLMAVIIEGG